MQENRLATQEHVEDREFLEVDLDTPDAVDQSIFAGPGKQKLGGAEPDISVKRVRLRIGRRPTARNLRKLYELLKLEYPKDLALFEQYEVWLLSYTVQLRKDGGFESVQQLGCQIKYQENGSVSIAAQIPESEFIKIVNGRLTASADLSVTGQAKVSTDGLPDGKQIRQIAAGVSAGVTANSEVNLSFSVMTPKIVATGTGDFVGEWSIKRAGTPLWGEQDFLHVLLVPVRKKALDLEIRSYVVVDTLYFARARLNSEWIKISVPLDSDAGVGREG
jgi:hypothetical protein